MTLFWPARIGAVACLAIFAICLFAPGLYLANYGVSVDPGGVFAVQRGAPTFLLIAILLWVVSTQPPSDLRRTIVNVLALLFGVVALTGIYHIVTGQAGPGLWSGVIAEGAAVALLLGFRDR